MELPSRAKSGDQVSHSKLGPISYGLPNSLITERKMNFRGSLMTTKRDSGNHVRHQDRPLFSRARRDKDSMVEGGVSEVE